MSAPAASPPPSSGGSLSLRWLLPGLLMAATGVGAGDLAGAAFAGSKLGLAVLWAVAAGALIKFTLTEGLTRWQLAAGESLLAGAVRHLGKWVAIVFLVYLLIWTWTIGGALMSACGVAAYAFAPDFFGSAETAKIGLGIAHSLVGLLIVRLVAYRHFEAVMGACIAVMFVCVLTTAVLVLPPLTEVLRGLFVPTVPAVAGAQGLARGIEWTLGLMGGVGGTLTILCYGYWIREQGRRDRSVLRSSRIDLAVAYLLTALFGMAMIVLAAGLDLDGRGAQLIVLLGQLLGENLGPVGQYLFLIGAWAAVFSSLLGVWQAAPYLFADAWELLRSPRAAPAPEVDRRGRPYRLYTWIVAIIPMASLVAPFAWLIKANVVFGALVMPGVAALLLALNNRRGAVGEDRNGWLTNAVLIVTLLLFLYLGARRLEALLVF